LSYEPGAKNAGGFSLPGGRQVCDLCVNFVPLREIYDS